jgi:CBS domain-containing protein
VYARDVMTAPVVTAPADTPVKELAALLTTHRISGVPIVDDGGQVIGIVSESDYLTKLRHAERHTGIRGTLERLADPEGERKSGARVASELMTSPVITADVGATVRDVVGLMTAHKINRVPIVDGKNLVGIVTRADVLRTFMRSDAAVTEDVRRRLVHDLWFDNDHLSISTENGIVRIQGEVDKRSDVSMVERWATATDGVVGVDIEQLRYRLDDRRIRLHSDRLD